MSVVYFKHALHSAVDDLHDQGYGEGVFHVCLSVPAGVGLVQWLGEGAPPGHPDHKQGEET